MEKGWGAGSQKECWPLLELSILPAIQINLYIRSGDNLLGYALQEEHREKCCNKKGLKNRRLQWILKAFWNACVSLNPWQDTFCMTLPGKSQPWNIKVHWDKVFNLLAALDPEKHWHLKCLLLIHWLTSWLHDII